MSLFRRRLLQQHINELQGRLSTDEIKRLVKGLNSKKEKALASEWELMLVWAFTRHYHVEYEPGNSNERRVDLVVRDMNSSIPLFCADITTVSDRGYRDANPVDRLVELIVLMKRAYPIKDGVLWDVKGSHDGEYRDSKMLLSLPKNDEDWQKLKLRMDSFFKEYCDDSAKCKADFSDIVPGLVMSFDPNVRFISGHHPSYTATYSLSRNPVMNALAGKYRQLKQCDIECPWGIIVCDGGCELIHKKTIGANELDLAEVVRAFLRKNPRIAFVVTIGVESSYPPHFLGTQESHALRLSFFRNENDHCETIFKAFTAAATIMPTPTLSAQNALSRYYNEDYFKLSAGCDMTVSENKVSVSLRWLMTLLANRVTLEQSFKTYHIVPNKYEGRGANPFLIKLCQGQLPINAEIISRPDLDDDEIEFLFGPPDPAISPLRCPDKLPE